MRNLSMLNLWSVLQPGLLLIGLGWFGWVFLSAHSWNFLQPQAVIVASLLFALFLSVSCQLLGDLFSACCSFGYWCCDYSENETEPKFKRI
jgi:hypothetical protein